MHGYESIIIYFTEFWQLSAYMNAVVKGIASVLPEWCSSLLACSVVFQSDRIF